MGVEVEDLAKGTDDLTTADMEQFVYPHDRELEAVGVRGIYLNNYFGGTPRRSTGRCSSCTAMRLRRSSGPSTTSTAFIIRACTMRSKSSSADMAK